MSLRFVAAALLAASVTAGYTPSLALKMGYLSSAAYCDSSVVTPWTCQACSLSGLNATSVTYLENDSTENYGFVATDAQQNVYVSYRGSDNLDNWINNIDAVLVPYANCANCKVHQGFLDCYNALSGQLDSALSSRNAQSAPGVYLTGHSLGAAMTMITTFDLAVAGYPVKTMLNFGQPRAGDPTYAQGFATIVINGADGVSDSELLRFNVDAMVSHMQAQRMKNNALQARDPSFFSAPAHLPINPLQVRGVARALAHPSNAHLGFSELQAADLLSVLSHHATVSVAAARGEEAVRTLLAEHPAYGFAGVHEAGGKLALSDDHLDLFRSLTIPLPESVGTGAFSAAQAWRVTHNADIVPHLPPEVFGYAHSVEEVWYNEASTNYTMCSTTNGEDSHCSDSIDFPISVADHLDYLAIKIDGLC